MIGWWWLAFAAFAGFWLGWVVGWMAGGVPSLADPPLDECRMKARLAGHDRQGRPRELRKCTREQFDGRLWDALLGRKGD